MQDAQVIVLFSDANRGQKELVTTKFPINIMFDLVYSTELYTVLDQIDYFHLRISAQYSLGLEL
jgi:hypothetical protein